MSGNSKTKTGLGYMGDLVWQADPDRFLSLAFVDEEKARDLLAIFAFNVEVAKTAEVTSEAITGEIRLQWWREAIEEIYAGQPRQHEVVQALYECVSQKEISRHLFDELIDARTFDLYEDPFASEGEQTDYIDRTAGHVVRLACSVLDGGTEDQRLSGQAGKLWGRLGLLRALGFHARRNRTYILDEKAGRDLLNGNVTQDVKNHIAAETSDLEKQYESLRKAISNLSPHTFVSVLPTVLLPTYLSRLKRPEYDPFQRHKDPALFYRQVRMWWASWRNSF